MPGQTETDERLIERVAANDRDAMNTLVKRYAGLLHRFLSHASGGAAALAEDAVQETFLSIWQHAETFRGERARAWVFAIARNALMREARRRGRVEPTHSEATEEASLEAAGFGSPGRAASFECALESREHLAKGLARIGEADRELVLLVDGSGLSVEEAAQTLGLGVAATKSRLHRARLRLMAVLSAEESS